jgi:hypothetical protein
VTQTRQRIDSLEHKIVSETSSLEMQTCQRTDELEQRIVSEIGSLGTQTRQ